MTSPNRHRLFLKLEALCNAHPDIHLGEIVCVMMAVHGPGLDSDFGYSTSDSAVEQALDAALAERGVTVSGGWQS